MENTPDLCVLGLNVPTFIKYWHKNNNLAMVCIAKSKNKRKRFESTDVKLGIKNDSPIKNCK